MKTIITHVLIVLFSVFALVACESDDEETYTAWGVTHLTGTGELDYYILLDDSTVYKPVVSEADYEPSEYDRVEFFFSLAENSAFTDDVVMVDIKWVNTYSIQDIVTVTGTVPEELGSDDIAIFANDVWQSNTLLNIPYVINYNYASDKEHDINLVYFPELSVDNDGYIYLELMHNDNSQITNTTLNTLHSFEMESIVPFQDVADNDSVPFMIVTQSGAISTNADTIRSYYYAPSTRN